MNEYFYRLRRFAPFLLLFTAAYLISVPSTAFAQQATSSGSRRDYKGWSLAELEQLFGPADRRSDAKGEEAQVVFFGDSMFVLEEGEVRSWSNAGDLDARRKMGEIRIKSSRDLTDAIWLSPWEVIMPITGEQVLNELLAVEPFPEESGE